MLLGVALRQQWSTKPRSWETGRQQHVALPKAFGSFPWSLKRWAAGARQPRTFRTVAKSAAKVGGMDVSTATCQLYQSMAMKLQRATARAILSRISAKSAASRDNTALAATSRSEAALVASAAAQTSG